VDNSGVKTTEIDDKKRGRLGVKGAEDLSGGLKAIYKFEWQVDTSTGNPNDGSRDAWVGLKGGWGQVTIGSNQSPYKYYGGVKYDALVTTFLQARDSNGANGGGMFSSVGSTSGAFGSNGFLTDSLSYKNKFGMAELWATYQFSEQPSSANVSDNYSLGLKFGQGAWEAFVATAKQGSVANEGTNTKVGGKFKMGPHSIAAQYETHSDDAANLDAKAYFVSGIMGFGMNQLILQAGKTDSDADGNALNNSDRQYLAVAFKHKFSKTTSSWIGYKNTDHKNGDDSLDQKAISAGMRVVF